METLQESRPYIAIYAPPGVFPSVLISACIRNLNIHWRRSTSPVNVEVPKQAEISSIDGNTPIESNI